MNGNAQIESVKLGYEDHGIMTCFLILKQKGSGQGFGGFAIDGPYDDKKGARLDSKLTGFWIRRILQTVGVEDWSDLPGKYVRVDGEKWGKIYGIGHITEDRWFHPEKELKEFMGDKITS